MKQYENYIDKEKAMHSVIFLLANLGGSAKREVIGEFLIDIFGIDEKQIEKDAQNWLDDIRLEMGEKKEKDISLNPRTINLVSGN